MVKGNPVVTFTLDPVDENGTIIINVHPSVENLRSRDDGVQIFRQIAINCIRSMGMEIGLEGAIERVTNGVYESVVFRGTK